jgi:hypothetical protein
MSVLEFAQCENDSIPALNLIIERPQTFVRVLQWNDDSRMIQTMIV